MRNFASTYFRECARDALSRSQNRYDGRRTPGPANLVAGLTPAMEQGYMYGLKSHIWDVVPHDATDDADILLSSLLPLAFQVAKLRSKPWPFCEAIGPDGRRHFYPRAYEDDDLREATAQELEEYLRLGILAGAFRSVALAELSPFEDDARDRLLSIDLYLARRVNISILLPIHTKPRVELGSPFIVTSKTPLEER